VHCPSPPRGAVMAPPLLPAGGGGAPLATAAGAPSLAAATVATLAGAFGRIVARGVWDRAAVSMLDARDRGSRAVAGGAIAVFAGVRAADGAVAAAAAAFSPEKSNSEECPARQAD